jgi:hypothetical protein
VQRTGRDGTPKGQYAVEVWFECRTSKGLARFTRRLLLPFAPYPGLRLSLPGQDGEGEVAWLAQEQLFACHLPDNDLRGEGLSLDDARQLQGPLSR